MRPERALLLLAGALLAGSGSGLRWGASLRRGARRPGRRLYADRVRDEWEQGRRGVPELNAWKLLLEPKGATTPEPASEPQLGALPERYREDLSAAALEEIGGYWEQLRPELEHLSDSERGKVEAALELAYRAHQGQARKSGEPFIVHPVAVAGLLAQLNLDTEAVCAGLLHDTVEDTDLTFDAIAVRFGSAVSRIVEGETKVSKLPRLAMGGVKASSERVKKGADDLEWRKKEEEQAENLRQMFIAMADDFRIIVVKLADRLHNMRTLRHMPYEKQLKISRETLDIFAPLAHRLGIWHFKSELEDYAFMYLYPKEYRKLQRKLKRREDGYRVALESSKTALIERLRKDPMLGAEAVGVAVTGRMKEMYSLWMKMEHKDRNLDRIQDTVALRVVLDVAPREGEDEESYRMRGVWLCYHVLGLVQHLPGFTPIPAQVKDYISFPKPNGYQSLHTSIMHDGQVVEVQIRTGWMHKVAQFGLAAHWQYKKPEALGPDKASSAPVAAPADGEGVRMAQGGRSAPTVEEPPPQTTLGRRVAEPIPWLSTIKEWQDEVATSREFVDSVRSEVLGKRVFVFLRDGKILNLSRGATVLDAAFQIHTEVGLRMTGASINGRPVPPSYTLRNGDVVSIATSPLPKDAALDEVPRLEWIRSCKTRSARSKLRSHFRANAKCRARAVAAGENALLDASLHAGVDGDPGKLRQLALGRTGQKAEEDMLVALALMDARQAREYVAKMLNVPSASFRGLTIFRGDEPRAAPVAARAGARPLVSPPVWVDDEAKAAGGAQQDAPSAAQAGGDKRGGAAPQLVFTWQQVPTEEAAQAAMEALTGQRREEGGGGEEGPAEGEEGAGGGRGSGAPARASRWR